MDLKIFESGKFTEKDYNDFCNINITMNQSVLSNGSIYVFYKPASEIGYRPIDKIEQLDKIAKVAEVDVLVATQEITEANTRIGELKPQIAALDPKQGKHKQLTEELNMFENKILMAQDTIKDRTIKISSIKTTAQSTLAEPATATDSKIPA